MELAGDNFINCNWCVWNSDYRITKGTGGLGSWWTSGDHPNNYIIENGQNTETWRLEETCCHSNSSEKPSANTDVKNSNE